MKSLLPTLVLALPLAAAAAPASFSNPLTVAMPDGTAVQTCADPVVFKGGQEHAGNWYMYCTSDPLHDKDVGADGRPRFRQVPMFQSTDLVRWEYAGDAFPTPPAWAARGAGMWAPDVRHIGGRYVMYFGVTDVVDAVSGEPGCDSDSAIGVATSAGPLGPWQVDPVPVVAPRRAGTGCKFDWTYDPRHVAGRDGKGYLYYGSYQGGMFVQPLRADAMAASGAPTRIAVDGRYEGAEVVYRDGMYYLFASASNCCNGALTGYGLYVARARHPAGPFVDAQGNSLLAARVGGAPLLAQNGNRWVGPGHNTVFADAAGQWWTAYHAIDRRQPYLDPAHTLNRRPVLLDRLDWVDGWPVVAGGAGPSDGPQRAPAAQVGGSMLPALKPAPAAPRLATVWTDRFDKAAIDPRWRWVRPPAPGDYASGKGGLRLTTRKGDLYGARNDASVLAAAAPPGDFVVEAELRFELPAQACCGDPLQAGMVLYGGDDDYVKLVHVALGGTRQLELAREVEAAAPPDPRYGNTVMGAPGERTWLRLSVRRGAGANGEDLVSGSSRQEGRGWVPGATWTMPSAARRIGLVAMGGEGGLARFGQLRVSRMGPRRR
ncbi:MAG: family 43 glycosylhydrolase [Pseudomonadota bacterium]